MSSGKVHLWVLFGFSVMEVAFAVYLYYLCSRVHDGVVTNKLRMHVVGHAFSIGLAYWLPIAVGISQMVGWSAWTEGWGDEYVVASIAAPVVPMLAMYTMLKGSGYGDPLVSTKGNLRTKENCFYSVGDHLKYVTLGGTKKPAETSHHCEIVVGPPVAGLEVLEVMHGGYLRLLFPRQLFAEAIPGGQSVVLGPFQSVTHSSLIARDDHLELHPPPAPAPNAKGVTSEFIATRFEPPPSADATSAMQILMTPALQGRQSAEGSQPNTGGATPATPPVDTLFGHAAPPLAMQTLMPSTRATARTPASPSPPPPALSHAAAVHTAQAVRFADSLHSVEPLGSPIETEGDTESGADSAASVAATVPKSSPRGMRNNSFGGQTAQTATGTSATDSLSTSGVAIPQLWVTGTGELIRRGREGSSDRGDGGRV